VCTCVFELRAHGFFFVVFVCSYVHVRAHAVFEDVHSRRHILTSMYNLCIHTQIHTNTNVGAQLFYILQYIICLSMAAGMSVMVKFLKSQLLSYCV